MSCYEKLRCERRTACRPSGCEQENAAAALSARNDGQQSFSAACKHRHNPPSVTSVFKIRIRVHSRLSAVKKSGPSVVRMDGSKSAIIRLPFVALRL
jgi:hypothetical protein